MALQLMKLNVVGSTATAVTPVPTSFFFVTTTEIVEGGTLAIDTALFFDDTGATPTELPALSPGNSMYNVYVNGVQQMQGITAYTPGATGVGNLSITVPVGSGSILAGTPVVLEIINFVPASTTTIDT